MPLVVKNLSVCALRSKREARTFFAARNVKANGNLPIRLVQIIIFGVGVGNRTMVQVGTTKDVMPANVTILPASIAEWLRPNPFKLLVKNFTSIISSRLWNLAISKAKIIMIRKPIHSRI